MTLSRSALLCASLSMPLLSCLGFASPAFAQTVMLGGAESLAACPVQNLVLAHNTSATVDMPYDIRDASVTSPTVANVLPQTSRRFAVLGLAMGRTDATVYDALGRCALKLNIRVTRDTDGLDEAIAFIAPAARVQSRLIGENLFLSGAVSSRSEADRIIKIAQGYVAKPEQVVSDLSLPDSEQVMLNVLAVEVDRTTMKQLGFNTQALFGQLGMDQYVLGNSPGFAVNGGFQGGSSAGYQLNTTSQPVATSPVATLFQGLGTSSGLLQAAQAVGILPAQLAQFATSYLLGTGGLTAAQQGYARQYLTGLLGSVSAPITEYQPDGTSRNITLQAADVGIGTANLPAITQQYLAGGAGLTDRQIEYLNALYKQIPNYANSVAAPDSTYIDRTNPANAVATGRAGETGLNQARAIIQAYERNGLMRSVSDANLVSVSGEAAKMLSGGEFPVQTGTDDQGRVSLEFKPYGVGLGFTPTVLSSGRISVKFTAEVSELSSQGAITLPGVGGAAGATIPGLTVSRTGGVLELPSGGSMMVTGLTREQTSQSIDKVPGVGDLPVIGALGRGRDLLKTEKELVFIVTATLVRPTSRDRLQTPADGLRIATDSQANGLGRVNQPYRASPDEAPTALASRRYEGPIGHVID